jgi:hypothetical protein
LGCRIRSGCFERKKILALWPTKPCTHRESTMKPTKSILDESFAYTPSTATAVEATWKRFGWQPMTDQERSRRSRGPSSNDARVVELQLRRSA